MKRGYKALRGAILTCPSILPTFDKTLIDLVSKDYLRYSVGIEIETEPIENGVDFEFKQLIAEGYIMNYSVCSHETSFRIPNGVEGLIGLDKVLEIFKKYYAFNEGSGIHYHIDCSDIKFLSFYPSFHFFSKFVISNQSWILKSLNSWKYKGTYNSRNISYIKQYWVIPRETYSTVEFRIGEMSFDYQLIVKRILHLQNIVHKLKTDYKKQLV